MTEQQQLALASRDLMISKGGAVPKPVEDTSAAVVHQQELTFRWRAAGWPMMFLAGLLVGSSFDSLQLQRQESRRVVWA